MNNAGARITWTASNQISDASDVTLSASSAVLNLASFSDTINDLYLVTGTAVQTGAGGILKVTKLFINGVQQPEVAKIAGDGYVTGSGYIEVGASGPPIIETPPATPITPVPADLATVHPVNLAKLDWADCSGATSYDVYFWLSTDTKPESPTATVALSEYTLSSQVLSLSTYNWQVVAKNDVGPTAGLEWTFTTLDRRDISNYLGIAPEGPAAGILIDDTVGIGNTGRLVGLTRCWWGVALVSVDLNLNGNTLQLERGWNTPYTISSAIFGDGVVRIEDAPAVTINGSTGSTYTGTTVVSYSVASLAKSAGNALCGEISVINGGSALVWTRSDQISDLSNVTLATTGTKLNLAGFSDTIAGLTLAAGTSVETGTDGVLTTGSLTVDGTLKDPGTYTVADGFVTGTGRVVVGGGTSSTFDTWAATYANGQTAGEDFNHDGVSNGVAYFMGMNGLATNPGVVAGKVAWPRVNPVASFEVQVSDNLTAWLPANPADVDLLSDPTQVIYTLPTGAAKQFCRLVVTP
ncbi:MAG: hypothetical protein NTW21_18400 [Verrucomicrobia bacterium]|nr:hypothetical protein [Verrucomicrobiota bacterium]